MLYSQGWTVARGLVYRSRGYRVEAQEVYNLNNTKRKNGEYRVATLSCELMEIEPFLEMLREIKVTVYKLQMAS